MVARHGPPVGPLRGPGPVSPNWCVGGSWSHCPRICPAFSLLIAGRWCLAPPLPLLGSFSATLRFPFPLPPLFPAEIGITGVCLASPPSGWVAAPYAALVVWTPKGGTVLHQCPPTFSHWHVYDPRIIITPSGTLQRHLTDWLSSLLSYPRHLNHMTRQTIPHSPLDLVGPRSC